jgi:hypothetical protein
MPSHARRFFREIHPGDELAAASLAMSWGYPRDIEADEALGATWIAQGDDALAWFTPAKDGVVSLHACAAPDARGTLGSARTLAGIEAIAELRLGAEILVAVFGNTTPRDLIMRRYLGARGWSANRWGCAKALGD